MWSPRDGWRDGEEGFTLIELLVVVLILGILMAIAIPTFLSLTGGARTSAAEADLTTAAQDEAIYLTQNGSFDVNSTDPATATMDNIAAMQLADAGINWAVSAGTTAGTKTVGVEVDSNGNDKEICSYRFHDGSRAVKAYLSACGDEGTSQRVAVATGADQPAQLSQGPQIDQPNQVLYLETAGSDGNYYWIEDVGGTLAYGETTTILDPGTYPSRWQIAWNQLPSQVEDDS